MSKRKTHLKGVNDIMTRTGLPGRNSSMAQRASLLARLEHKRLLLETQARVWEMKRCVAERRLGLLQSRIRNVRQMLDMVKPAPQAVTGAGEPAPAPEASRRRHTFEFSF
jgi:hypothetical protein